MAAGTDTPRVAASVELAGVDLVGTPVLIHTFADPFRAQDGTAYTVKVYGQERSDGTWIGWLEFVAQKSGAIRRTPRETTQSNREQLYYWATGVQHSYLTGAFSRTT